MGPASSIASRYKTLTEVRNVSHSNPAWTDDNTHDPGVTLLEALIYNLSDNATDFGRRLRIGVCGWRCVLVITLVTAGAVLLIQSRPGEESVDS